MGHIQWQQCSGWSDKMVFHLYFQPYMQLTRLGLDGFVAKQCGPAGLQCVILFTVAHTSAFGPGHALTGGWCLHGCLCVYACVRCRHIFCYNCIVEAIKATRKCPKCRKTTAIKSVKRLYPN